ncbi:8909_t:CDS:2 [Diversispora eburnea]|uniref:Transmembrane protein 198 n=1 Tax=Diversispora eburnea TaxID=1213867 RepID=A0A9N8W135_9GLOM|nr:8909_t:CDS:2 [Diversispora eburnea]
MYNFKNSSIKGNYALLRILICLLVLFSSITYAEGNSGTSVTIQSVILGIILIVTGVVFCFFGRRIWRLTLFLLGFYIGCIFGWIILTNFEPDDGYGGSASPTIMLVLSLVFGLVGGLLFVFCASIAIWLLGALAGYALAMFLLSWSSGGIIHSKTGQIIFIVIFALAGLLLTFFFEEHVIIIGTSFIGSYALFIGIDMFANTGFYNSVRAFMDGNHDIDYEANTKVYLMLVGMIVVFVIGALCQYKWHRGDKFGPEDRKGKLRFRSNKENV